MRYRRSCAPFLSTDCACGRLVRTWHRTVHRVRVVDSKAPERWSPTGRPALVPRHDANGAHRACPMDRLSRLYRMDGAVGSNVMSYEEFSPIIDHACAQIGSGLRALCLFGSCLQPGSTATGGIPDLGPSRRWQPGTASPPRLHYGVLTRFLATGLPPLTLALRDANRQRIVAKLNLIEISAAAEQLTRLPDLYLAGRMSKEDRHHVCTRPCLSTRVQELSQQAARQIAALAVRELPVRTPLVDVVEPVLRCPTGRKRGPKDRRR